MRVVSGSARGISLNALEGLLTRPTTDRVKESMFNILQFDLFGKTVLDLFAGSGALGIEALSRGAKSCTFVDQNTKALSVVRSNLERTGLLENATLACKAYNAFLEQADTPFGLVFLDPPYASDFAADAVQILLRKGLLLPGAIIVWEHDGTVVLPDFDAFIKKTYRYGKIFVTVYRNEENSL